MPNVYQMQKNPFSILLPDSDPISKEPSFMLAACGKDAPQYYYKHISSTDSQHAPRINQTYKTQSSKLTTSGSLKIK